MADYGRQYTLFLRVFFLGLLVVVALYPDAGRGLHGGLQRGSG
jgi:hypothetical protein